MWVNSSSLAGSPNEYYRKSKRVILHAKFFPSNFTNDIALILLTVPVKGVPLAKINRNANIPATGNTVTALGFGVLENSSCRLR